MDLTLLLGIIAVAISALSLIVSFLYNRWALKNAKVALEKSDEHILAQLTYEGKKQSLRKMMTLFEKPKKYYKLKEEFDNFLKTPDAILLPTSIIQSMFKQLGDFDDFYREKSGIPEPEEPSDKEIERWDRERYEEEQQMSKEERFEREARQKMESIRINMMGAISRELNFPITPERLKPDKKAEKK